ncbi:MAG: 16S rRNA (cytosine(1402)-N(4))-methyltransferase RsmH [Bacteroidales bacterium]|nr:16S rRNA (cytosine(1402)-N(4))-methyltransferase RsmH [Bacteroidales bacterium]
MCIDKAEQNEIYHVPVLLTESLDGLHIHPSGIYVDVTFGGGGHSRALLEHLGPDGRLFGFDQDMDASENILHDNRFVFVRSNFRYLRNFMRYYGVNEVDGILADLGVSSHHFDEQERGFSFRFDTTRLDMRMNQNAQIDAVAVLNEYDEEELSRVFFSYGELKSARRIAQTIVRARSSQPVRTVEELLNIIRPFVDREREKKMLAQLFQALRIEVNDEMGALKEMLLQASSLLKPGGRLVVITYHSLEDRLVKNFFRSGNFDGVCEKDFYGNVETPFRIVNSKVIVPTNDELEANPRSRSAKLRIAEKK